jgi:hypothetical protein
MGHVVFEPYDTYLREARADWEAGEFYRRTRTKLRLGFDELLLSFQNTKKSVQEIAADAGVTQARISHLYKRYFKKVCEAATKNKERRDVRRRERHEEKYVKIKERFFSEKTLLADIARLALTRGCTLELVPSKHRGYVRDRLSINGHSCSLHRITQNEKGQAKAIIKTSAFQKIDTLIFLVEKSKSPKVVFIIPRVVMEEMTSTRRSKSYAVLYLKAFPPRKYGRLSRIKSWEYKDAWQHLEKAPPR